MLKQLNIRARLTLAFGLLIALIAAMAAGGLWSAQRFFQANQSLYQARAVPLAQLGEVQQLLQRDRLLLLEMLNDPGSVQRNDRELAANQASAERLWTAYAATDLAGPERELAQAFETRWRAYLVDALLPAATAMREGRYDDSADLVMNRVTPAAPEVLAGISRLVALQVDEAARAFEGTRALQARLATFLGLAVLLALGFGVLLSWRITRSITRPLAQAVEVARRVADGDLRAHVAVVGRDETAALLEALMRMNNRLADVVARVHEASDGVATGAAEIARGTADLSQRTEAQAANLEETAAAMDELNDTVRRNAEAATEAHALVAQAEAAAARGGEGVVRVEATMEAIAQGSRRIGDIIGVIDSIAFQTNILALNAAVEAARAGEQGRGFAVVAAEVRALAQRSGAAAREIRGLITTSMGQVDEGAARVAEASAQVRGVADQVRRVATLVQGIALASDEQARSVSQVAQAVAEGDQATQHNAALVEQSAAACDSLRQQAHTLTAVVGVFRLP